MDKCGIKWERQPFSIISGHIEYEPMTKCGEYTCSDECYKTWAYCPHCGKSFEYKEEDLKDDNLVINEGEK